MYMGTLPAGIGWMLVSWGWGWVRWGMVRGGQSSTGQSQSGNKNFHVELIRSTFVLWIFFETFLLDWKAGLWVNWRALQKAALLLYLEHGIWRILQVGSNFLGWSFQAKNKESATSTPATQIPEFISLQEAMEAFDEIVDMEGGVGLGI